MPKLDHNGVIYNPPNLHPTIRQAVRFPQAVVEYESAAALLSKVGRVCNEYFAMSESFAAIAPVWISTTWIPELFAAPPILCVTGTSMADAMRFFRLLGAFCRRAIIVSALTQWLPTELRPTLLVVDSGMSKKVRASWRVCNFRGVYLATRDSGLREFVFSKAIYSETEDALGGWGEEVLRIVLLPAHDPPLLGQSDLEAIADEFQPQFELFRLRHLQPRVQPTKACTVELFGSELGRELFSLLAGEPGIAKWLLPVAEQQKQTLKARQLLDPLAVIIEVIWGPAHKEDSIPSTEVQKRVNTLRKARGENLEFSAREIGWRLSALDLRRHRTAKGMVLKLSLEHRKRIHRLARQFGLALPKEYGCAECVRGASDLAVSGCVVM